LKRKDQFIREAILYRLGLIKPYIKHWPDVSRLYNLNKIKLINI
jgi:hypothetical protein